MKTLKTKILLSLIVVLAVFSFTACDDSDRVHCKDVQVELVNTTRRQIYYSFDSKFCDRPLGPGERLTHSFGRKDIDLNRTWVIHLDYRYHAPGNSYDPSIEIEIIDCLTIVYLE